ncbi:MAG: hypothetical protein ACRC6K_08375 [Fusobacteriaceae bacterium]
MFEKCIAHMNLDVNGTEIIENIVIQGTTIKKILSIQKHLV